MPLSTHGIQHFNRDLRHGFGVAQRLKFRLGALLVARARYMRNIVPPIGKQAWNWKLQRLMLNSSPSAWRLSKGIIASRGPVVLTSALHMLMHCFLTLQPPRSGITLSFLVTAAERRTIRGKIEIRALQKQAFTHTRRYLCFFGKMLS